MQDCKIVRSKTHLIINGIFFALIIGITVFAGLVTDKEKRTANAKRENFMVIEADNEISALYSRAGKVYVGTNNGVGVYDANTLRCLYRIEDISLIYSAEITGDDEGNIYIGHEQGLMCIGEGELRKEYGVPDIPKGRVNTVCIVGDGIWCGTYNGAARLIRTEEGLIPDGIYTSENGLKSDSVNVIMDIDDGILIASYLDVENGGITIMKDSGDIEYIGTEDGLPHPYVTSCNMLKDGSILVGCGYMKDGGLALLRKVGDEYKVHCAYSKDNGLPGEKIRYVYSDEECIMITTEYDGIEVISAYDGEEPDFEEGLYISYNEGLSDNEVKCIVRAGDNYWLGTKKGVTLVPVDYIEDRL